mgnify:CR=1 FL=1
MRWILKYLNFLAIQYIIEKNKKNRKTKIPECSRIRGFSYY